MSSKFTGQTRVSILIVAVAIGVVVAVVYLLVARRPSASLPLPGSSEYEQFSRTFYRGLAELDVGLLDNARQDFDRAAALVPEEPASWVNLAITRLRLGEADEAVEPIARATSLAPDNSDVALAAGKLAIARGQIDEGLAELRRSVSLAPDAIRPRVALAEELERSGQPNADLEASPLYESLLQAEPTNLAILVARLQNAARRNDEAAVRDSIARLEAVAPSWPPAAREQLEGLARGAAQGSGPDVVRATVFLRNVLVRVPAYLESLAAVRTPSELIAEPLDRFVAMPSPDARPAPADMALKWSAQAVGQPRGGVIDVAAVPMNGNAAELVASDGATTWLVATPQSSWRFPGAANVDRAAGAAVSTLVPLDWNHDFRVDLLMAGAGGLSLLVQQEGGAFVESTPAETTRDGQSSAPPICGCAGAWAADIEMDGDLDVVLGLIDGPTTVLRNNGDHTWQRLETFAPVMRARAFVWADLDGDADPDAAFLDAAGALEIWLNRQAGNFTRIAVPPPPASLVALAVADLRAAGRFLVVAMDTAGAIRQLRVREWDAGGDGAAADATWDAAVLATWSDLTTAAPGTYRLLTGDLDNNGAIDLMASGPSGARAWLTGEDGQMLPLPMTSGATVSALQDLNDDGRLDLVGVENGAPVRLIATGERPYHWKVVRARAQQNAGDQRINAFGVGGEIEVRAGPLIQKQLLTGAPVHVGLGTHTSIDVARIVWPNGVPQAEFDLRVDDTIVAEQRLKGSCPWVFTNDGSGMQFVTDFLWRSPLGLRINAQDTAGTSQTEDWVKIRGDQLAVVNGHYDVRITAELWETHFFDHVSLMVVDRPADTEVFVDERFSRSPPTLKVHVVRPPRPVIAAWDHAGHDVTDAVAARDGRYLASFSLGKYQGVAGDHVVEFDAGRLEELAQPRLIAHGWVYPTDSSLNVAMAQGSSDAPQGLALEAQDAAGGWRIVNPDLGFPAGKNKTMVIDMSGAVGAKRLRLRTNLEIYWDALMVASEVAVPVQTQRLALATAELRYRGYSMTTSPRGPAPETPEYARLSNTVPRWRDLTGYHTRFGDVRELLLGVDDRYVIMNAGDELRMTFAAPSAPPSGGQRDFVLIGDGWEKDGDYNTDYSQTVLPLPTHARTDYRAASASLDLEDDPVYRQHADDWQRFHTRYVSPKVFLRGLRH